MSETKELSQKRRVRGGQRSSLTKCKPACRRFYGRKSARSKEILQLQEKLRP